MEGSQTHLELWHCGTVTHEDTLPAVDEDSLPPVCAPCQSCKSSLPFPDAEASWLGSEALRQDKIMVGEFNTANPSFLVHF